MVDEMGLDLSLRTAMSGLRTVQKGLDTVSSNIANADTPGYTRKVLTQSTVVMDGKSLGVQTGNIEREVDTALQRETLTQESRVSRLGFSTSISARSKCSTAIPNRKPRSATWSTRCATASRS